MEQGTNTLSLRDVVQALGAAGIVVTDTTLLAEVRDVFPEFRTWVATLAKPTSPGYEQAALFARSAVELACVARMGVTLKTDALLREARRYDPDFGNWIAVLTDPANPRYAHAQEYIKTILGTISGATRRTLADKLNLNPAIPVLVAIAKQEGDTFRLYVDAIGNGKPEAKEVISWVRQIVEETSESMPMVDTSENPVTGGGQGETPLIGMHTAPQAGTPAQRPVQQAPVQRPEYPSTSARQQPIPTPHPASSGMPADRDESPEPMPLVAERDYEVGSSTTDYGRCYHVYNVGNAALMIREDKTRSREEPTITVEMARNLSREQRTFNWREKIIVQLTVKEMMHVLALLTGEIGSLRFVGHGSGRDKGVEARAQDDSFFFTVFNRDGGKGVKVLATDTYPMIDIILGQLQKNYPNMTVDLLLRQMKNVIGPMMRAEAEKRPPPVRRAA